MINQYKSGDSLYMTTLNILDALEATLLTQIEMLTRKGIYPYEYKDNFDKFKETSLPSQKSFFSKLSDKNISDKEYNFGLKMWNDFNIKIWENGMIYT